MAADAPRSDLRGGSGLVIGGRVLAAVAPDGAAALSRGRRVLLVSGTNGKTTTTALLAAALADGRPVGSNRGGANTGAGLAGTLATSDDAGAGARGGRVVAAVGDRDTTAPRCVVLTNLTRDQLSRHHEVAALAATWRSAWRGCRWWSPTPTTPTWSGRPPAARRQVWVAAGEQWTRRLVGVPRLR